MVFALVAILGAAIGALWMRVHTLQFDLRAELDSLQERLAKLAVHHEGHAVHELLLKQHQVKEVLAQGEQFRQSVAGE